jgi:lipoyl(octanoyl) transferase
VAAASQLWVCQLGLIEYRLADILQERVRAARQADAIPDVLLMLEHPPVYTRGRRSDPTELAMGEDWYRLQGIDVADSDRGGHLTYHGPGQLVGYPIMRVSEVAPFVRTMEEAIVAALADEGIAARGRSADGPAYTGTWVGERKIASIGVHVSRGVTKHGFAVNVDNDLQPFEWIVPCGIDHCRMASLASETGHVHDMHELMDTVSHEFGRVYGRRVVTVAVSYLLALVSGLEAFAQASAESELREPTAA